MALLFFRKKHAQHHIGGNDPASTPVYDHMADKQTKFEALVHALHGDLYRYAYWLTRDPAVAEDLVQETFLRAWKAIDTLLDDKAAKSWLITILRRENARRFERKQFDLVDLDEHPQTHPDTLHSEQEMEHEWLRRHIGRLPEEYQEPLLLQVVGGFSGDEIAEMLGLNKNTVMTRLFRARNQIKEAMEQKKPARGHGHG
ncbi:sigma-70 family RNA polymerase sigma factor [Aeromonas enteropelogenes]|uniref:sigma-70 family RNA polymerase sigma factor n=1 Tax=Aeromonas enteropelogenes TaxID=29489 RepID=UPI0039869D76